MQYYIQTNNGIIFLSPLLLSLSKLHFTTEDSQIGVLRIHPKKRCITLTIFLPSIRSDNYITDHTYGQYASSCVDPIIDFFLRTRTRVSMVIRLRNQREKDGDKKSVCVCVFVCVCQKERKRER